MGERRRTDPVNLPNKTIVKKFYQEVWNEKKVKAAAI